MNLQTLLGALLPGLAPVLIFVAADAIFGEVVGLVVGLLTGVGEFIYSLVKHRKADPFVAADTILLAVAGGLSLLLRNEIFFKLKPAIIEAVLAASLAVLLLLPQSVLKGWMNSQLRGVAFPDSSLPFMKKSLLLMTLALVAHVGLTVWAAFTLSTAAWGFISGGLLYILFGIVALVQFFAARLAARGADPARQRGAGLPVIDEAGKVVQVIPEAQCHQGPGRLHPRVHLIVANGEGSLYLRQRLLEPGAAGPSAPAAADAAAAAVRRGGEPGGSEGLSSNRQWEQALSFHVRADETIEMALGREMGRQLGIALPPLGSKEGAPQLLARYRWDDAVESELIFAFVLRHDGPIGAPGAADGGRFWSSEEIRQARGKGAFSLTLERELDIISQLSRPHA